MSWPFLTAESFCSSFRFLYLNKHLDNRLPIICISLPNLHFNQIVKLMNDKYGIQTRGGISCSGLFAKYIEKTMNIKGELGFPRNSREGCC